MKKLLIRLFEAQFLLVVVLCAGVLLTPYGSEWQSFLAGGGISIAATLPAWLIFRRMPEVVKGRTFFFAMVVSEVAKWLVAIAITTVLLQYFSALGIVVGFIITYVGSYAVLLKRK